MEKEILLQMLAEATGLTEPANAYEFTKEDQASVLLSTGGPVLILEQVSRIEVRESFLAICAARADVYFIEMAKLIGIKIQRRKKSNAGFLP
jgi:hypothetical protein